MTDKNKISRRLTSAETRKLILKIRREDNKYEYNYFERVKNKSQSNQYNYNRTFKRRIYFDCETFELYSDPNNPDEDPIIIPYLIGWNYAQPGTYQYSLGIDAAEQFLSTIFTPIDSEGNTPAYRAFLVAFNVNYDFQCIRPYLIDNHGREIAVIYEMTDTHKFIRGELKGVNGKKVDLYIRDLWRWDTTKSLKKYMDHIVSMAFNSDGSIKRDKFCEWATGSYCEELANEVHRWGFTSSSFEKTTIDYKKVNLHKRGDNYYYWHSKEDWINGVQPTKLDLESELNYLKNDVLALPIIEKDIELFRKYTLQLLRINNPLDIDWSITLPGFGKYLCEEYTKEYFTETLRMKVGLEDYKHECRSYVGAFVAGNKDITYMDEVEFKKLYPSLSFYDESGQPRIKSYDVNSMYPKAMRTGLPCGTFYYTKPKGRSVEWVEIHFTDWWDKDNPDKSKRLYQWKPKYACLNNSFFGDGFGTGLVPKLHAQNRVYVLRETLDLFYEMCDAHVIEVCSRWQKVYDKLDPFIDTLYEIKANRDNKWPKSTITVIKLILNSLYGKLAEKYKEVKIVWINGVFNLLNRDIDNYDLFLKYGLIADDKEDTADNLIKARLSPYINVDKECGYLRIENQHKRYDMFGDDCRESILAGAYVTMWSRWKLLSTVKGEIDNGNIVLYCDTDSIKFIQINPPKFDCDDKELGAWKYEGSYTHFGHPNKKKKYFMYNKDLPEGDKNKWMVKTSGVPVNVLKPFDLETIKQVYNPNNRVIVVDAKNISTRNEFYQIVIRSSDYKFVFDDPKDKPTHILSGGKLTRVMNDE